MLEISLQVGTYFYFNTSLPVTEIDKTPQHLRILALGESTTDKKMAHPANTDWPKQLEVLLQEAGISATVFNEGRGATTSSLILNRLPEMLDKYSPQVVISMMGINDHNYFWMREEKARTLKEFLRNLKIVRLVLFFVNGKNFGNRPLTTIEDNDGRIPPSDLGLSRFSDWLANISLENQEKTLKEIEDELTNRSPIQKAQFYAHFARSIEGRYSGVAEYNPVILKLYEKTLELSDNIHFAAEFYLGHLFLSEPSLPIDKCYSVAEKFLKNNTPLSYLFANRVGRCASYDTNQLRWKRFFSKYGFEWEKKQGFGSVTRFNHRNLSKLLKSRNIYYVAVGYPVISARIIKGYFRGLVKNDKPDLIISNQKNFRNVLQKEPFDNLFVDRFALNFGHATPKGNQLIAERIFQKLLPAIQEKKIPEFRYTDR